MILTLFFFSPLVAVCEIGPFIYSYYLFFHYTGKVGVTFLPFRFFFKLFLYFNFSCELCDSIGWIALSTGREKDVMGDSHRVFVICREELIGFWFLAGERYALSTNKKKKK